MSGLSSQKTIERIDAIGITDRPSSHWVWPCEGVAGGVWGLLAVQESPGEYSLYFAPVPNITRYEVTFRYSDGSSKMGTVDVPR